ncbi:MAG: hypothetical protein VX589_06535 [Myxococcota bacterium]|nr:hypothetical protein [Myxococcota bacterium]
MNEAGLGLSRVPTDALKALLRHIYRKNLSCPFDRQSMLTMGLNQIAEDGSILCGLDESAVRAVIVCVLAERRR